MIALVWRIVIVVGYALIAGFISWRGMRNQLGALASITIGLATPFAGFCVFYLLAAAITWIVVGKV